MTTRSRLGTVIQTIRAFALRRKYLSTIIALAIVGGGYWTYKSFTNTSGETRYVMTEAKKDTVVVSITGTGQVSASNQIDLKAKASGDVISVPVISGQEVKAGALLVQLDSADAAKAVRDAEANLKSAQLSLEKLKKPADALSLVQAQNTLDKAQESKRNAEDDLSKSYDDSFNNISNAFLDLPTTMTGLQDILFSTNSALGGSGQQNADYYAGAIAQYDETASQLKDDAYRKFQDARTAYDKNFNDYKAASRFSDTDTIVALTSETYETTKTVAEAVKSANNLIQRYEDKVTEHHFKPAALADTHLATLNTYTGKMNTHLLNLSGAINTIKNDKESITNATRTIAESTESLNKLKAGADTLDIQSSELTVEQRHNALLDAQGTLANYSVRAPFDGTVAKLNVKKADSVSGSTAVATLITKDQIAEISLNEVDVAKIKVGQKVTLTFDAVDGLEITGKVADVDTAGTVTQGVVTYGVKIGFDTQDDRVKPGMSVSAAIIINVKQDVLTVANSAVKSQNGGGSYVEMFDAPLVGGLGAQGAVSAVAPRPRAVEIGISNDTVTEIVSGLKEGDQVVSRTIAPSTATTQQAPSLFGTGRNVGGGGTGVRTQQR